MKRSYLLKVVSILMLLAAMVRFVMGVMMFNFYTKSYNLRVVPDDVIRLAIISFILILVYIVALVVCGFMGALSWDDPDNAPKCVFYGLGTLVLGLLGNYFQWKAGYSISWPVWVSGAAAPALFCISALIFHFAYKKHKANKASRRE